MLIKALFLAFCSFSNTQAASLQGIVESVTISPNFKMKFLLNGNRSLDLVAGNPAAQQDLNTLEVGDYLSSNGGIDEINKIMTVENVEFIGMKKLIGTWTDNKNVLFWFKDFINVNRVPLVTDPEVTYLKYILVPENKTTWTIFLSDSQQVRVGSLTIPRKDKKEVFLQVYDSANGQIVENFKLLPLNKR